MPDDPMIPLPLTWEQWGAILIPLYFFLVFWVRWCMQHHRPSAKKRHPATKR